VTVQLAIVVVAGLPLLALTQPVLPPFGAPALFVLAFAFALVAWWRGATDLRGHTRAGAEVIVSVLAKQMESGDHAPARPLEDVHKVLPGLGEPVAIRVENSDHAAGRSLADLDLRSRTGAVVLAIDGAAGTSSCRTATS
jgi:CPA2 family monovalent cation:H+ antiporter-2